jgi:glycosyltransferase involved in cell wall biosynthesis
VRRKNVDLVIKAYFRSGLHEADTSLVLVGQGPCGGRLRRQVAKLGLSDRVVVLDSVKNGEMPGVYALAEFAVLASQFDQWGMCIRKAFAAGRPAIVTKTCGVADELVVDGVNGFIVEPGNVEMLADRIALLGTDLALRERFAHNAWSAARYWTPHLFASNLIDLSDSDCTIAKGRCYPTSPASLIVQLLLLAALRPTFFPCPTR